MNRIGSLSSTLGCALPALVHLGCGGGGAVLGPAPTLTESGQPRIDLPARSGVGQAVTAAVRAPEAGVTYRWTIAHGSLPEGRMTVTGPRASFTPTRPGTATFTCEVVRSGRIRPEAVTVQVRILPELAPGRFREAGRLQEPRAGLAALALGPDQVLITGGSARPGHPGARSAELYTPSTRVSVRTYPMAAGRTGHAMARLDDRILVTGGIEATEAGPNAETCDPDSGQFTPAGPMAWDRRGHTATVLPRSGGVLVAGGVADGGTPVAGLERFVPGSGTFTAHGTVELGPGHSATLLASGQVLLVGRTGSAGAWRPWAGRFDPATGSVTPTAGQPAVAREGQVAVQLPRPPRVLVLGGRGEKGPLADAEWYDPATDTFQACPEAMLVPRQDFGAALLPSGELLIAGGSTDGTTATRSAERFDPVSQCFAPTRDLLRARRNPRLVSLPSGSVLVLGGTDDPDEGLDLVESYSLDPGPGPNPGSRRPVVPDSFREAPTPPKGRKGPKAPKATEAPEAPETTENPEAQDAPDPGWRPDELWG